MNHSEYRLGIDPDEYKDLPYLEALKKQRNSAKDLYMKLYKEGKEFERMSMVRISLEEIESCIKLVEGDYD